MNGIFFLLLLFEMEGRELEEELDLDEVFMMGLQFKEYNQMDKAFEMFQIASNMDITYAMHELGCCYARGDGVGQDLDKAIELWQRAATDDSIRELSKLGMQL